MSKKRNLFALLICLVLTFVCLVSCVEVTLSPELAAKQQAETDAQEVLGKLVWDDEDREKIVTSLSFATENRNYPGVKISWSSSEEDIISSTGKVNRTDSDDPRNVLVGEDLVAEVVITATVVAEYSWDGEAGVQSASTEPISKQFVFTVLAKPEGTDTGTIADVKLRAWNYVYVEQGVDKALVSNSSITYNVMLSGVITAKLQADGATKGFMLHDGTDGIYVYGDNTKFNVGDSVEVIGGIYSYYGSLQVGSNVSVSKSNVKVTLPEYKEVTPQAWEDQNKGLGDDVIGHLGGDLYKVEGYLTAASNSTTSDEFCITDANTGEVSWIYYKSYNAEMKAELEQYVGKYVKVTGLGYDRDSRIVKNHLLWDGGIEEATAPVVDDQTKANVALSQITLGASYTEDFDLNENGVWEVVSGTGIQIVDGVAKVTRGTEDQVVVLKVTVTVGEATASKELTVTIKKVVQEQPTIEYITISEAIALGTAQEHNTYTEEKYYIKGTVTGFYNTTYGNFYVTDGTNQICVYGLYSADGTVRYDKMEVKPVDGDEVIIYGVIGQYNGTPQFKNAWFMGFYEESKYDCISIEEAIALGTAQAHNTYTEEKYYIEGTVTGLYNTTYGNMYVTDGTNQICVYGLYSEDGTVRYDKMEVKPVDGDKVVIYGVIGQYNGTPQFKNAWLMEVVGGETPAPHEHKFVDGKCECGEKDPNYVAPDVPVVAGVAELTVTSLGIGDQKYEAKTATVNGIGFEYIQLGNYGNGIQMRDKDGKTSFLWNTSAFGKGITKIELVFNSAKSTYDNPNAVIFSFGNAMDSLTYSTKLSTVAGVKTYTITPDASTYTFFKLEHDISYSFYWDSITIYFDGEAGVTPEPPVHEHEFVNGKCECGEKDPNYVEPTEETISISEAIALGSAQAHNTYTTEKYYIEGTVTGLYNTQYGNFYITDGTNQICIYGLYSADGKVRYDAMEVKPVDGDKVKVYGVIGQYNGNPQFKNAWLIEHDASAHEHKFVDGVCSCGEKDPNYVAPELPGNVVEFDFTAGTTSMDSAYNSAEAEMTVNGYTFGYLQMKASGYSGSNFLMFCKSTDAHLYNKTAFASAIIKVEVTIPSGASATAGYFLSLHKEAAAGNIVSTTKFVGNNASFSIEATAADGYTFFNLSSDSSTGKNGQLAKIVVTLADGSVVVPPVHEHEFVNGECACGEKDPNYVAPEAPATVNKADLDTLNGGKHSSSYLDYTSTNGWTVTGCAINSGSADASSTANPSFGFLGGPEVRAVTLNGGTDKTLGTVKSAVLSGGLSKLSFNYTNLFTDTKFSVTVYIKDAQGNVLKEEVVSYDNPNKVKYEVRTFELEFAVEGDFVIEIVNNRPNNLSGNKDRATIWNIEWVSAK